MNEKAASRLAASSLQCRRKDCRQSHGNRRSPCRRFRHLRSPDLSPRRTPERAAARPARASPKRAAVDIEWPLPHWGRPRFPSGPRRIGARSVSRTVRRWGIASSITLSGLTGATSLETFQRCVGTLIPAIDTLLEQPRANCPDRLAAGGGWSSSPPRVGTWGILRRALARVASPIKSG